METDGRRLNVPSDFAACPIWRRDRRDDLLRPVESETELLEGEGGLLIRAKFTTPGNDAIEGCVNGVSNVFAVGLFSKERIFWINRNAPKLAISKIADFLREQPQLNLNRPADLFPLRYQTTIYKRGYRDFSGQFYVELD